MSEEELERFVAVGDVHAEDVSLEAILDFARSRSLPVLAVGDFVDGHGDARRTIELLAMERVHCVRGNHDRWLDEDKMRTLPGATPSSALDDVARAFLARLPATRRFATPRGTLLLCHGLGDDDMAELRPDHRGYALQANDALREMREAGDVALVVHGHTHERMIRRLDPITFINPGTLLREHSPAFMVVDIGAGHVEVLEVEGATLRPLERIALPE